MICKVVLIYDDQAENVLREIFLCVEQGIAVKYFNIVLKICPKLQGLSFHFSEVNYLLDEYWAKNALRV